VATSDLRASFETRAIGQGWADKTPAIFVLSGIVDRMAKMKESGPDLMRIEVGLAAQNFFLEATALSVAVHQPPGIIPPTDYAVEILITPIRSGRKIARRLKVQFVHPRSEPRPRHNASTNS